MSDDIANWLSFLALCMSATGTGISVWAKRDSKLSSDAAERSAQEANKSRRIQQAELLASHFNIISDFMQQISSVQIYQPTYDLAFRTNAAIKALQGLLPDDTDLQNCLSHMLTSLEEGHPTDQSSYMESVERSVKQLKSVNRNVFNTFDSKRRELLNIG